MFTFCSIFYIKTIRLVVVWFSFLSFVLTSSSRFMYFHLKGLKDFVYPHSPFICNYYFIYLFFNCANGDQHIHHYCSQNSQLVRITALCTLVWKKSFQHVKSPHDTQLMDEIWMHHSKYLDSTSKRWSTDIKWHHSCGSTGSSAMSQRLAPTLTLVRSQAASWLGVGLVSGHVVLVQHCVHAPFLPFSK